MTILYFSERKKMTANDLATDYFKRCKMRFKALKVLLDEGAYPGWLIQLFQTEFN